MKFNENKYIEMALTAIMLDKYKEFNNDNSKTFEDGIMFGYLMGELLTFYRYKNTIKSGKELSKGQQIVYDTCKKAELRFGFDFINYDYMIDNYIDILREYTDEQT